MSDTITIIIDGVEIKARPEQTIMEAADEAGIYIPRLCYSEELKPHGSCRVCTVTVNGRPQAACTQPVAQGMVIENDTEALKKLRADLIEMLIVEGNHFCPFCEMSGNCDLQGLAYRLGVAAPKYPFLWQERDIDATHPDVFIDRNCCVLCGKCVTASKDLDGKNVFQFVGRGIDKKVAVNAEANMKDTDLAVTDKAVELCPVAALIPKRTGYQTPIGQRKYDHEPIGSDIEKKEIA